ncbi:hypothetical protein RvY_07452-2 [Ramazzottius varieornatus]|uniref:Uncharacterized protein n=1 Tax=Ramazzottius varieornatus TaxID=947166 RepID=A0A1D1V286_RAMVA|nr:hypothetical protein RvY_07452-2 [Ramazzottius varieornatus]
MIIYARQLPRSSLRPNRKARRLSRWRTRQRRPTMPLRKHVSFSPKVMPGSRYYRRILLRHTRQAGQRYRKEWIRPQPSVLQDLRQRKSQRLQQRLKLSRNSQVLLHRVRKTVHTSCH